MRSGKVICQTRETVFHQKSWKLHFRDPKFQNFLGKHAPRPPLVWGAFGATKIQSCVYTFKILCYAPGQKKVYLHKLLKFLFYKNLVNKRDSCRNVFTSYLDFPHLN